MGAFEQWEGKVVAIISDPISAGHTGQALIQLNSHQTVCHATCRTGSTVVMCTLVVPAHMAKDGMNGVEVVLGIGNCISSGPSHVYKRAFTSIKTHAGREGG